MLADGILSVFVLTSRVVILFGSSTGLTEHRRPAQQQALNVVCYNKSQMQRVLFFIILLFFTETSIGQISKKVMKKMGLNPVIFLDSIETEMNVLQTLNPLDISNIDIVRPKRAKNLLGYKGIDGVIYITTIKFVKEIFWKYLSTKSDKLKQILISPQSDSTIECILNGKSLSEKKAPGILYLINDKNFKTIDIYDRKMSLHHRVTEKRYLVLIKVRHPKRITRNLR